MIPVSAQSEFSGVIAAARQQSAASFANAPADHVALLRTVAALADENNRLWAQLIGLQNRLMSARLESFTKAKRFQNEAASIQNDVRKLRALMEQLESDLATTRADSEARVAQVQAESDGRLRRLNEALRELEIMRYRYGLLAMVDTARNAIKDAGYLLEDNRNE